MLVARWLTSLTRQWGFRKSARARRGKRRSRFTPQLLLLEDRCLLSGIALIPLPKTLNLPQDAKLSDVMFDGKTSAHPDWPAPPPAKLFTFINNTDSTVYPILTDANNTLDTITNKGLYDPFDPVNNTYRGYIGYVDGGKNYLGLLPHQSITVKVPLAFWDAGRAEIVTLPGAALTSAAVSAGGGGSGYKANDVLTVQGGVFATAAQLKVLAVDGSGAITGVSVLQGGSYSTLPTSPVSVTGGSGTNAKFTVKSEIGLTSAGVAVGGSGYKVGDVLTVQDGQDGASSTPAQLRVTAVDQAHSNAIITVDVIQAGSYSSLPTSPVSVTGGSGTLATFTVANSANPLQDSPTWNYKTDAAATAVTLPAESAGGVVMWYHRTGLALGIGRDASAQLIEMTTRDKAYFTDNKDPWFPHVPDAERTTLINYDVSYVDTLMLPVAMEVTDVPLVVVTDPAGVGTGYKKGDVLTVQGGDFTTQLKLAVEDVNPNTGGVVAVSVYQAGSYSTLPTNPVSVTGGSGTGATFTLAVDNYAWVGANQTVPQMQNAIAAFTSTDPAQNGLNQYFGADGKGFDKYFIPRSIGGEKVPSGYNLFADSPLANVRTTYQVPIVTGDQLNRYMLASGGDQFQTATTPATITNKSTALTGLNPDIVKQAMVGMFIQGADPNTQIGNGTTILSIAPDFQSITMSKPALGSSSSLNLTFVGTKSILAATPGLGGSSLTIRNYDTFDILNLAPGMRVIPHPLNIPDNTAATVKTITRNSDGSITVALNGTVGSSADGQYTFVGPPTDYVASTLTNLWYSWADFYYNAHQSQPAAPGQGTTHGTSDPTNAAGVKLDLTDSTLHTKLIKGMLVTADAAHPTLIPDNTTITDVGAALHAAAVVAGGKGYTKGDVVTLQGGVFSTAAQLTVTAVDGSGAITAASILQGGSYTTLPTSPASVTGGSGTGATFMPDTTTITWSVTLSQPATASVTADFTFTAPPKVGAPGGTADAPKSQPRSSEVKTYTLGFTPPQTIDPDKFAYTLFDVMTAFTNLPPIPGTFLSPSAQLMAYCIGCNVGSFAKEVIVNGVKKDLPTLPEVRLAQLRDELKSLMRGVDNFNDPNEMEESGLWYPDPAKPTSGSTVNGATPNFNVLNLNPYVFFVHKTLGLTGYAFSVDDDVADIGGIGASKLSISIGGLGDGKQGLPNKSQYTWGAPFGPVTSNGTIDTVGSPTKITGLDPKVLARVHGFAPDQGPGALVTVPGGPAATLPGTRIQVPVVPPTGQVVLNKAQDNTKLPSGSYTFVFSGFLVTVKQPASATPVQGNSTNLSVLGSIPDGENTLKYTWSLVSGPAGVNVTFSANGTNAAKNTTATFDTLKPGTYVFRVTITDLTGLLSVTSDVTVMVPSEFEGLALNYLTWAYDYAYAAYFYGSPSAYGYAAFVNSFYALAYAQLAASTHSATDWYYAYLYANAAQSYAYQDYLITGSVYSYYAFAYDYYGSLFAYQAYLDEKTS
jgi:hypothetical protein